MEFLTAKINTPEGLHARPAKLFCALANQFRSEIRVRNATTGSEFVNAKSILLVLTLGVVHGHEVEVTAAGDDEAEAIRRLRDLVESNFPA